ncbi:MAG: primase C-terminal domain-containing protein [Thermodesulfobacteriota bacterium]|nr:primase C-terminal domain-containing protein [Thermodesulfobacteriota bacterium]
MNKIQLFQETFRGRQDVVPRHWVSKDGKKNGYSPLCKNEWNELLCQKTRGKPCRTCKDKDHIPLSDDWIRRHLDGVDILGVYPLLADNTCGFVAGDFDNHNGDRTPLADVKAYYEACQVQEIPCYILRSKSGKGYHTYIFFNKPVPAWKARAVAFALLQEAGVIGNDADISSFDRLFPNQDHIIAGGIGNLIALPFQKKARKKGHTLFLDPDTGFADPLGDQWKVLSEINRIDESDLDKLIEEWSLKPKKYETNSSAANPDGWLIKALEGVDEGIPGRDSTATKIAGYFTDKLPKKDILAILLAWNSHNRPPLETGVIRKIVDSVKRYKKGESNHVGRGRIKISIGKS